MKRYRFAAATAIVVLIFAAAPAVFAGNANGHFQGTDGSNVKNVEFNAVGGLNGSGTGNIVFAGPVDLPADEDHPNAVKGHVDNFTLHVDVDCVNVNGNRASVSGIVKQSSVDSYVGQRLLLAVEDNGAAGGRFTWGTYNATPISWTPSDAERVGDAGWAFSWYTSDFERVDDTPVMNKRADPVNCQSFSLASFDWLPANGTISVR
jgi:hypothetical protein